MVENVPEERLSYTADDGPDGRHYRYGEPAPTEFFAHWYDEDSEAASGSAIDEGNEGYGGNDVPAKEEGTVICRGLFQRPVLRVLGSRFRC